MTHIPTAIVTSRAAARLRAGHLWIYRSDVFDVRAEPDDPIVAVFDDRGYDLGYALYSSVSQIVLRHLAPPGAPPGREFLASRLAAAVHYRDQVVSDTTACRLVNSDGDLLPSLVVDRYNDCLVLQTLSRGADALTPLWVELLTELLHPSAIIARNDVAIRRHEDLPQRVEVLAGAAPSPLTVHVNGIPLRVDLLAGQKTGAFLDQRENYAAAARHAHGRALDAFCFAGGFALHLAPHCSDVLAVDISSEATALAAANAELAGAHNVATQTANVVDFLRALEEDGERFDTVVLDPPAFAKGKDALAGAARGYKEINLRALRLLNPGGILVTCSCSFHMGEVPFLAILASAAADAGRRLRLREVRGQARDHPILLGVPETRYLTCVIAEVIA